MLLENNALCVETKMQRQYYFQALIDIWGPIRFICIMSKKWMQLESNNNAPMYALGEKQIWANKSSPATSKQHEKKDKE